MRFFVATARDAVVGCGGYKLLAPDVAEIKRMYVRPAYRGRRLWADDPRLTSRLRRVREGVTVLRLETGIWQPEALGLYERCGYTASGHLPTIGMIRCACFMRSGSRDLGTL